MIADIDALATLPTREFNQGFTEIIKHAIISDAALFETLENFERENLEALVRRNIEIKAEFVAADERDTTGERALLNFGHTVGHAIDTLPVIAICRMVRQSVSESWPHAPSR